MLIHVFRHPQQDRSILQEAAGLAALLNVPLVVSDPIQAYYQLRGKEAPITLLDASMAARSHQKFFVYTVAPIVSNATGIWLRPTPVEPQQPAEDPKYPHSRYPRVTPIRMPARSGKTTAAARMAMQLNLPVVVSSYEAKRNLQKTFPDVKAYAYAEKGLPAFAIYDDTPEPQKDGIWFVTDDSFDRFFQNNRVRWGRLASAVSIHTNHMMALDEVEKRILEDIKLANTLRQALGVKRRETPLTWDDLEKAPPFGAVEAP